MALDSKSFIVKGKVSAKNLVTKASVMKPDKKKRSLFQEDSLVKETAKLVIKGTQTEHKGYTQPDTKGTQTEHKGYTQPDTKGTQTEHKNEKKEKNGTQRVHTTRHKWVPERNTNGTQTEHISSLTGNQLKLVSFFFEQCKLSPERSTPPMTISYIFHETKITKGSIKTTLSRLKAKGLLYIISHKDGRGGWVVYALSHEVFNQFLLSGNNYERNTNGTQTEHKGYTQPNTQPDTNGPSSIVSIKNTTTTNKPNYDYLQEIQTPEFLKNIGFGINHIKQLKEKFSIETEEIQKCLEAFAFDLENGELERLKIRGIKNIIGYFFGAMKNGGYNSVKETFISAEALGAQNMLERLQKRKEEKLNRQNKLEKLLFEEWIDSKSKQELVEIESPFGDYLGKLHQAALKSYFLKNEIIEFQKNF